MNAIEIEKRFSDLLTTALTVVAGEQGERLAALNALDAFLTKHNKHARDFRLGKSLGGVTEILTNEITRLKSVIADRDREIADLKARLKNVADGGTGRQHTVDT